jgi:hypothetical protein
MITSTDQAVIRHVGNVGRTSSVITSTVTVVTGVNLVTRETNVMKVTAISTGVGLKTIHMFASILMSKVNVISVYYSVRIWAFRC